MGVLVVFLFVVGVALLAYGLSLVYAPLAPITGGLAVLGCALVLSRSVPRGPR